MAGLIVPPGGGVVVVAGQDGKPFAKVRSVVVVGAAAVVSFNRIGGERGCSQLSLESL
jgi:hypothetical protein